MSASWTPGPWYQTHWDSESFMNTYGVVAPNGRVLLALCNCEDAPTPTDADLRLIAASPELASLLREARDEGAGATGDLGTRIDGLFDRIRGDA